MPTPPAPRARRLLGEPLAAWVTLAGGVLAVWGYSAASYTIPVLMRDIVGELGWGRGEFAAATATRTLTIAVSGFLWGALTDRLGGRPVLVTGALVCAAGLLGFGAMQSLGAAAALGLVMGTGMGALGIAPASALVARRFGPRRGLALGLVHGCDNLLNSFVPGATAALLTAHGWRATARVFAGAYALVAVALLVCVRAGEGRTGTMIATSLYGSSVAILRYSKAAMDTMANPGTSSTGSSSSTGTSDRTRRVGAGKCASTKPKSK